MLELEIVIPHPKENTDVFRSYSHGNPEIIREISQLFKHFNVTPATHPRVIDLCSGDGSIARMVIDMGWQSKNMTCVDLYISPTPLVHGVTWEYMNLETLAFALKWEIPLPNQIQKLHHAFDVVTEMQGYVYPQDITLVSNFFARPQGYILWKGRAKS